jgi:hypothetical protein
MSQGNSIHATNNGSSLADPYMQAAQSQAAVHLQHLPPDVAQLGLRLLQKLSPPQWALEWYLPKWLGDFYTLDPSITETLVLANLYGLVFIVLQDQVADEGLDSAESVQAVCLGTALHHLWIRQYVHAFASSSSFWHYFDTYMHEWTNATAASNRFPAQNFGAMMQQGAPLLAGRAAPLKICCAAACTLSQQEDQIPVLAAALDRLHLAAVLLDHVHDWRRDLAAGRYNTFVHFASDAPQIPTNYELNRQRVYEQLLLKEAAQPYFALAADHMRMAIEHARKTGCQPLVDYLDWYHRKLLSSGHELAASARTMLRSVVSQLFF